MAELAFLCLQNEKDTRLSTIEVMKELKKIQSKDYNAEDGAS